MSLFDSATDAGSPAAYGPSQTALMLLDFHNLFVEKAGGPGAPAAVQVAASLREWAHKNRIPVIHGLIDPKKPAFATCKGRAGFENVTAMMCDGKNGDESSLLNTPAAAGTEDVTFTRTPGHVSALKSPGLLQYLQNKGVKSLILTGLSTSGCVLRTSLAACDDEFVVTVISDACADAKEGVHDFVNNQLLNNRGYVATAAEFRAGFESHSK